MSQYVPNRFHAFRIHNNQGGYRAAIESVAIEDLEDLDARDLTIKPNWSGIDSPTCPQLV